MQISDKGLTTAQVAFGNYIERGMGNSCCRSANLLGRHESRANPAPMGAALSIMHRANSGFLIGKAALSRRQGHCGAVILIKRFGSALKLKVHFQC
jgi:hypothetical protein